MDHVNLLPLVCKASVPEVIKVKSLRLCLGEHGRATLDIRRLGDSLMHFDIIWGMADNTFTADPHPLQLTAEELFAIDTN